MSIGSVPKTKAEARAFYDAATATTSDGGAAAGTGVSIEAQEIAYTKTLIRFENTPIVLADEAGVGAYGSLKIFDLPVGLILVASAVADLAVTKSSAGVTATFDGDFGVGSAAAGNNAVLAGTEQDIIPTTATPQAVAGATTAKGVSTAALQLDGTAGAKDVFLNFLVDDADQDVTTTPCNLIVNGTLTLIWANAGDK